MKSRSSKPLFLGLLILATAAFLAVNTLVNRHYEYKTMLAPRSLHQMTTEFAKADESDRSDTVLFGAGLMAMSVLVFGGFIVAMNGGGEFLRQLRLNKRRPRRSPAAAEGPLPTITSAPRAPMLGAGEVQEGLYE